MADLKILQLSGLESLALSGILQLSEWYWEVGPILFLLSVLGWALWWTIRQWRRGKKAKEAIIASIPEEAKEFSKLLARNTMIARYQGGHPALSRDARVLVHILDHGIRITPERLPEESSVPVSPPCNNPSFRLFWDHSMAFEIPFDKIDLIKREVRISKEAPRRRPFREAFISWRATGDPDAIIEAIDGVQECRSTWFDNVVSIVHRCGKYGERCKMDLAYRKPVTDAYIGWLVRKMYRGSSEDLSTYFSGFDPFIDKLIVAHELYKKEHRTGCD